MYSNAYVWSRVLSYLEQHSPAIAIASYFDDAEVIELTESKLVIYSPSPFRKDVIVKRYIDQIREAMRDQFQTEVEVVVLDETELPQYSKNKKNRNFVEFNSQYTFDKFVVGSSNQHAFSAARAVADNPADAYNPLFIYGESGLGKTHLLYAIAHKIHQNHPDYRIVYIKGDSFTNELIQAIREGRNPEFREKYRSADVFLMDDVQFIAGRESTQEEMFHTFNTLYEAGRQIVFTADRPPKEMLRLDDRLRTRFEWGLLADIQPPDFETRVAIVRRKAELMDLDMPPEVSEYIANKLKSNIRQLEGAVKKMKANWLLNGDAPTMANAQTAISDILNNDQPPPLTVEKIIEEVGRTFGVSPDDIRSSKRSANISNARQIAVYVVREITQLSMTTIGEEFGGRDHSTVVYAVQQVEKNMKKDSKTKAMVEDIIKNIRDS